MQVHELYIKSAKGAPMLKTASLKVNKSGVVGAAPSLPLRQVLIVPTHTLVAFNTSAEVLRANIVIDYDTLHDLESGHVLEIGGAHIRLTFHCESCDRLRPSLNPKTIAHRRGYLGSIVKAGVIRLGDSVRVLGKKCESIPFDPASRIQWYLERNTVAIKATELLKQIGFSASYCRVLPKWLEKVPAELRRLVRWVKDGIDNSAQSELL